MKNIQLVIALSCRFLYYHEIVELSRLCRSLQNILQNPIVKPYTILIHKNINLLEKEEFQKVIICRKKRWEQIIFDGKDYNYDSDEEGEEDIKCLLLKSCQELTFDEVILGDQYNNSIKKLSFPSLQKLTLIGVKLHDILDISNVRELYLRFVDRSYIAESNFGKYLSRLFRLEVLEYERRTSDSSLDLTKLLKNNLNLRALKLNLENKFDLENEIVVSSLTKLELNRCEIKLNADIYLSIRKLEVLIVRSLYIPSDIIYNNLRHLELHNTNIDSVLFSQIPSGLRVFKVSGTNNITKEDLIKYIISSTNLVELTLFDLNIITKTVIYHIVKYLAKLRHLQLPEYRMPHKTPFYGRHKAIQELKKINTLEQIDCQRKNEIKLLCRRNTKWQWRNNEKFI